MKNTKYILALDSANEQITVGVASLSLTKGNSIENFNLIDHVEKPAHRASNTMLIPEIDTLCKKNNINKQNIKYVVCGRGPGSFTGVRICISTAKGIAQALQIKIIGVCTLDAIAWNMWSCNIRGDVCVVADAMRKEVYPGMYKLNDSGVKRYNTNSVIKASEFEISDKYVVSGDGLHKYSDKFIKNKIADASLWNPTAKGLMLSAKDNFVPIDPSILLPIYTRLSDAEEAEKIKLADKNLKTGVQDIIMPMNYTDIDGIINLEKNLMQNDQWKDYEQCLKDKNQSWWVAKEGGANNKIIGYCGGIHAGSNFEVLKICVDKNFQKQGIAKKLISKVAADMRDLGATKTYLEVRKSNDAIEFYKKLGLTIVGQRTNYYNDGEDAIIMTGPLPIVLKDVAGMDINSFCNIEKNRKTFKSVAEIRPIILAIESSCDETAAAIIANGKIISNVVASQIDFHKRFGGVVPEIASRKHIEAISGLCDICIEKAGIKWTDLDAVASTYAPGLVGALVVGMAYAKACSWALSIPFIGVNHLEGHIYANKFTSENIELPAIASIISGGNTMLVLIEDWGKYKTLGTTIDDAVGEAFDKIAKALNLGYPGGPIISKLAKKGNPSIKFPRAMINSGDYKFSLSGLKTAVINYIHNNKDAKIEDICASFQQAVIEVQYKKAKTAIEQTGAKTFIFGGGVAANPALREAYEKLPANIIMSPIEYCGDNAAMIALVADKRYKQQKFFDYSADVCAHADLDIPY